MRQDSGKRSLTTRESEVARLVSHGLSNSDIGVHLGISTNTVKRHMSNIMIKLNASNRAEVVRLLETLSSFPDLDYGT